MDLRGAKSNVMSWIGTCRYRNCPLVAFWPHGHLRRLEFTKITKVNTSWNLSSDHFRCNFFNSIH